MPGPLCVKVAKAFKLPCGQERGLGWHPEFSDSNGSSSPFAGKWFRAQLCRMREEARSALSSPPYCEDPQEGSVQCRLKTKSLSETTQGSKLVLMDEEDFFLQVDCYSHTTVKLQYESESPLHIQHPNLA